MFSKILLIILAFLLLSVPVKVQAAGEFSSYYDITYSVLEDGAVEVAQDIKLKNLTDKFFPSSFSLTLPGQGVSDVSAVDSQGPLEVETKVERENTKVIVKFTNSQIIGLNKEYSFNLKFKDKKTAVKLGKIVSVSIPKVSQGGEIESFKLTLSVPTSFGDPDFISPKPSKSNESAGRINFIFDAEKPLQTGVSAIFGDNLSFNFELTYSIKNPSIFPKFFKIPIPSNSYYQKAYIDNIEPKPQNLEFDNLGNTLAVFKLDPRQLQEVKVRGVIQTFLKNQTKQVLSETQSAQFLEQNKFWESQNPIIKLKLSEILKISSPQTAIEKSKEIDKFVSNFLQFDFSRLEKGDFARFGSVTALNNPEKALAWEFVDLQIALLRASGIPSKQVIGFSFKNQDNRPFSFLGNSLHTWVEFYDPQKGWLTSDPAWENTTKGVDFFAFNDLNHLSLAFTNGSQDYIFPAEALVSIYEGEKLEKKAADLEININPQILSGFPSKAKVTISNLGNVPFPESELQVDTSKILLEDYPNSPSITKLIQTPSIPPFGSLEYDFSLKTGAIWNSYQDVFQVKFAGATDKRVITVVPILSYKIFSVEIFGALAIIILFYILVLLVHHKSTKKP